MLIEIEKIIEVSRSRQWVLEPDVKKILNLCGIAVPRFSFADTIKTALQFSRDIGYPLAAKIVSPDVIHKSDVGGVVLGIADDFELQDCFFRFAKISGFQGVLVEEMVAGVELIVGAKNDLQFGPVILLGIGGTGTEIYQDVTIRMAPLVLSDVALMVRKLKAHTLLSGFRGSPAIDMGLLAQTLVRFSQLAMDLEESFESIDLNPVICSESQCVAVDARIMLKNAHNLIALK